MPPDQNATAESVLEFWFGQLDAPDDIDKSKSKLWWSGGAEIDDDIRHRFGSTVQAAMSGELDHWAEAPRGSLALVILLDQFTRNLGRGTAQAFAGDPHALEICLRARERGQDRELRFIERSFLYMPILHAEDREMAQACKECFTALSREIKERAGEGHPDFQAHAFKHADIVLRFGRYPHRNEILGRTSTAEEDDFMASGGPNFGQTKKR